MMLSECISSPVKLKILLNCGGNLTCDRWFANTVLYASTNWQSFALECHFRSSVVPKSVLTNELNITGMLGLIENLKPFVSSLTTQRRI